jgi:hypothetical protein
MIKHVKALGWIWIANGILTALMVIPGLFIVNSNVPGAQERILVTSGALCFLVPGIIADFVAGAGLLKVKAWARVLSIVLAIINLVFLFALVLPLALGIYTLIIMFSKKTVALFKGEVAPAE